MPTGPPPRRDNMYITGPIARAGLRVTGVQALTTVPHLYFYVLEHRRRFIESYQQQQQQQNNTYIADLLNILVPQTLEEHLLGVPQTLEEHLLGRRYYIPTVYEVQENTRFAPEQRTTTKLSKARMLEMFNENGLNVRVRYNEFITPSYLFRQAATAT